VLTVCAVRCLSGLPGKGAKKCDHVERPAKIDVCVCAFVPMRMGHSKQYSCVFIMLDTLAMSGARVANFDTSAKLVMVTHLNLAQHIAAQRNTNCRNACV